MAASFRPFVLVIRAVYDHNDFFHGIPAESKLAKLKKIADVILCEVKDVDSIQRSIFWYRRKIDALIVFAHGNEDLIRLDYETSITEETLSIAVLKPLKSECTITFCSCSTSELAKKVAQTTNRSIFAPDKPLYSWEYAVNPLFGTHSPYPFLIDSGYVHMPDASKIRLPFLKDSREAEMSTFSSSMTCSVSEFINKLDEEEYEVLKKDVPSILKGRKIDPSVLLILLDLLGTQERASIPLIITFLNHFDSKIEKTLDSFLEVCCRRFRTARHIDWTYLLSLHDFLCEKTTSASEAFMIYEAIFELIEKNGAHPDKVQLKNAISLVLYIYDSIPLQRYNIAYILNGLLTAKHSRDDLQFALDLFEEFSPFPLHFEDKKFLSDTFLPLEGESIRKVCIVFEKIMLEIRFSFDDPFDLLHLVAAIAELPQERLDTVVEHVKDSSEPISSDPDSAIFIDRVIAAIESLL